MALVDVQLRKAKPKDSTYKLKDERGLFLEVRPSGKKVWRCRFKVDGKDNLYTIGEYPDVTLSDARSARDSVKKKAKEGISPNDEKRKAQLQKAILKATTFESIALEFYETASGEWSLVHSNRWLQVMQDDVFPLIGSTPIREVTSHDILEVLNKVSGRGAPTVAQAARIACGQVFTYAITTLRADTDPSIPLRGAVMTRKTKHHPGLTQEGLRELVQMLDNDPRCRRPTAIAIWLLMRLFTRTKELREASWSEFDLDRRLWSIPAARMKRGIAHVVPLPVQAVELLTELREYSTGELLFPNRDNPRRPMSHSTINFALGAMGWSRKLSAHGFRTTASTQLHEMGYNSMIIERQLAHMDQNSVRASYNHAEFLTERRGMLQDWSNHIDRLRGLDRVGQDPGVDLATAPAV